MIVPACILLKTHSLLVRCMVEFGVGLGPLEGKIWRIGLMGSNSTPEVVQRALDVFKKGLDHIGYRPQLKSGL